MRERIETHLPSPLPELAEAEPEYAKYLPDYSRVVEMVKNDPGVAYLIREYTPDRLGRAWLTMLVERDKLTNLNLLPPETRETFLTVGVALAALWTYEPVYDYSLYGKRSRPPITPITRQLIDKMWSVMSFWAAPAIVARRSDNFLVNQALETVDDFRVQKLAVQFEMFPPPEMSQILKEHELGLYLAKKAWNRFGLQDYAVKGLNPQVRSRA